MNSRLSIRLQQCSDPIVGLNERGGNTGGISSPSLRSRKRRQRVTELIDVIYDAAAAPELWQRFLQHLSTELDDAIVFLTLRLPGFGEAGALLAAGLDEARIREYQLQRWRQDPLRGLATDLPPGAVIAGGELPEHDQLLATRFYGQWLGLEELHPASLLAGVILRGGGEATANLCCVRRRPGAGFTSPDGELLRTLMPHLQRAVLIGAERIDLALQRDAVLGIIDGPSRGLILLDLQGRVLALSPGAERLAVAQDGLVVSNDRLCAANAEDTKRLRQLITGKENGRPRGSGTDPQQLSLTRPSGRQPLQAQVTGLHGMASHPLGNRSAVALVITDPEQQTKLTTEALCRQYDLTPAEARLAFLLAQGRSLREAADALTIRFNTARAHLRQIFSKTGVNRQAALVRLLLSR